MTLDEIKELVNRCTYKPGWTVIFHPAPTRPYIQLEVDETTPSAMCASSADDSIVPWKSGKRYLSTFMCRQEIVGAVFALIKDAEMHECHEWFRYKGASIYNPHLDPDVLADAAKRYSSFNMREDAMNMKEPNV